MCCQPFIFAAYVSTLLRLRIMFVVLVSINPNVPGGYVDGKAFGPAVEVVVSLLTCISFICLLAGNLVSSTSFIWSSVA